jgi:hypothetical protein
MPEEPTPEEWAEIEAAEAYLDALGNKRDFEGDQLGATEWRKDVDAEPLDMSRLPTARTTRGELPPTTGGTPRMAISEDAQIIRAAANDSSLSGAAQLAMSNMGDVQPVAVDRLADAVGAMQEGMGGLEAHAVAAAAAAGGEDGQSIQGAASVATEAVSTAVQAAEQARGLADQLNAAIQGASQAAESALAASEQFRQTCDGIATKHGA